MCGNHRDFAALAAQLTQDVLLDSEVVGDDVELLRFVLHPNNGNRLVRAFAELPYIRMFGAHDFGEIGPIHFGYRARLGDELFRVGFKGGDHSAHHPVVAQVAHQGARVDIRQHRNFGMFQVFFGNLLRAPIGADFRKLAHDQPLYVGPRGLVIFRSRAVVSDLRIGENYYLPSIGGISKNFLVAGDGSIENDFPVAFALRTVAFAAEDAAIFQRKDR